MEYDNEESEVTAAEEANPFGDWLRKARATMGWSRQKLAQESGVSGPGIYNLEVGNSRNPQEATRKKLEKALGETAPSTLTAEAAREQEVVGLGTLVDFDPYADDSLPDCPGVYVFYDITDRPVYVGKASKRPIRKRIREHYEKFWFRRPVVDRGSFIRIDDGALCDQVEQVLIKFLKSNALLNKQHVDRE